MLNRIIESSIRNRAFVIAAWVVVVLAGLFAVIDLPIDAVPDISGKQVVVNTSASSWGPAEMELQVTQPLEVALSGIPKSTGIRSISQFGLSQITVLFNDDVDLYWARQQVSERLSEARESLPEGVDPPSLAPIATGLGEIFYVFVEGKDYSLTERRTLLDWVIKPRLRTVPGVVEVNTYGGQVKEYEVALDPEKLFQAGVGVDDVALAIQANNQNVGGSFVRKQNEQQVLQGLGQIADPQDIARVPIRTKRGTVLTIGEIGEIKIGSAPKQGSITKDGQGEAVAGIAVMLMGENSRTITQKVKERLKQIEAELPPGVSLVPFLDRTDLVSDTLKTAGTNLVEGGILVILILFLFLLQFRAGLLVSAAIPLAMLVAIIGMRFFHVSANLMSLGAIDFGLIVDAAVIIVENCVRRLSIERRRLGRELTEDERVAVIRSGSLEVRQASQFGEIIIIAAYLPILALVGVEGKMFRPMAITVIFALIGALVLSATLIPALAAYSLRAVPERENPVLNALSEIYSRVLSKSLERRRLVVAVAVAIFAVGLLLSSRLGSEFLPKLDEGALSINPGYLPGISLETGIERATLLEKRLKERFPDEIKSIATRIGRPDIATDPMLLSQHDVFVELQPKNQWRKARTKEELIASIEFALADIPGMKLAFTQPIEMRMAEMSEGVGIRSEVGVKVFGTEIPTLQTKAMEIADIMRELKGGEDVTVETTAGLPMLQVNIDRDALIRYGLNVSDVNGLIETAIGGKRVGVVYEKGARFSIRVRLDDRFRRTAEEVRNLSVETPDGRLVPLAYVAQIVDADGPVQISREEGQRRIVIQGNVRGRDLGSYVNELERTVRSKVSLPPGYRVEFGGQYEHFSEARNRLIVVVPVTFAVVFGLLVVTYRRFLDAARVFTGIPLAISGGVFALLLRGMPFSISAAIGFIALSGIAVLADMVMVQTIRQNLDAGIPLRESVESAARSRLRPVLMTALVAAIGFVPMALSTGRGAEVQRPIATVVIGGLITSTLLTLFVLPALYLLVSIKNGPKISPSMTPNDLVRN